MTNSATRRPRRIALLKANFLSANRIGGEVMMATIITAMAAPVTVPLKVAGLAVGILLNAGNVGMA